MSKTSDKWEIETRNDGKNKWQSGESFARYEDDSCDWHLSFYAYGENESEALDALTAQADEAIAALQELKERITAEKAQGSERWRKQEEERATQRDINRMCH